MNVRPNATAVVEARAAGEGFANSRLFAILSRAGFVARGLIYGIIGVLALDLALGRGGKITNQQGALRTVEHQSFGHLLLTLLAVGLGSYSLWRLFLLRPVGRTARGGRQFGGRVVHMVAVVVATAVERVLQVEPVPGVVYGRDPRS